MSIKKYSKKQINPLKNTWEETGTATLTDDEVQTLNECTKHTGIKYEVIKPKAKK